MSFPSGVPPVDFSDGDDLSVVKINGLDLDVHPRVMKALGLKPGQVVDFDTFCTILEANRTAFIKDSANISIMGDFGSVSRVSPLRKRSKTSTS